jgi:PIN domain nuclease of toxin-antitoxin system
VGAEDVRLLLDTCTFLWAITDDTRLSESARRILDDDEDDLYLSAASVWEITTKAARGRLALEEAPAALIPRQREALWLAALPIDDETALATGRLPRIHGDPFDRLLVAHAIQHGLTILTPDRTISRYPAPTLW